MDDGLRVALTSFVARPRVLVAVDFDGTLAPFVTDPLDARPVPGAIEALRAAAALASVTTAVVSGRDLAGLRVVTGIGPDDRITLVGSHGAEVEADAGAASPASRLGEPAAALLATVRDELGAIRSRHPGVRLELKPTAVVLHTRGLPPETARAATSAAHDVGRRHPEVQVTPGKSVVELSVSTADKGSALVDLARSSRSDAILYVGDDATDERAFAALDLSSGDLTVKVGDGETVASHRLPDPSSVVSLLEALVELRREHPSG